MKPSYQRRQHVAVFGVIVIVGSVQVGRHHRDIIRTVLPVQEFAIFQSADLRQGICLVRLLQFSCQQTTLRHRLRSHAGIDTTASQELQLLASILPCRVDDVHLQNHVVVHEVRQCILISDDTAYFCCCKEHIFRFLLLKEFLHRLLPAQVQFLVRAGDNIRISLPPQLTHYSTSHHSTVACYIYFRVFQHFNSNFLKSRHIYYIVYISMGMIRSSLVLISIRSRSAQVTIRWHLGGA